MAKTPNLPQLSQLNVGQVNTAFDNINTAFENTISRDGSTPNNMLADLDMDSNDIINVGVLYSGSIDVDSAVIGGKLFTGTLTWRGDWLTSTSYQELDLVKINGNVYVCLDEHTSGVFASDLIALRWEIFVENATGPEGPQGDAGAQGDPGVGVPVGGTAGQVLAKIDGTNYNTEWVDQSGGAGVTDGDKGDITVSGSGATWTIDNNTVTLAKMADMATSSLIYRKTGGTGDPEVNTLATLKTDLGLTGTNSGDQTSIVGITGTKAQFDTAVTDGNFMYVGDAPTSHTHLLAAGATDVTITATNLNTLDDGVNTTLHFHDSDRSRANHTGTQTASTISDFSEAVDDRVSSLLVAGTNITLTYNDAANTLTVDASGGGGGSPGGSTGEIQYNNAGAFAGAADIEVETGQLRLPSISLPAVPAASGTKVFAKDFGNYPHPHFFGPEDAAAYPLQASISEGNFFQWTPATGTTVSVWGWPAATVAGTATAEGTSVGSRRARMRRIGYRVTVAAATAIAFWRINSNQHSVGGSNSWEGGFRATMHSGPTTGVAVNSSHRFFMGLTSAGAPTDVNPSTKTLCVGIGYDAADTQVQFMHNDASGTCTKIALGAGFPKPTVDNTSTYRLRMFSPPGTTQKLYYEVTQLESGDVATGLVTTDLPGLVDILAPQIYASVGGVSNVIGISVGTITIHGEPI